LRHEALKYIYAKFFLTIPDIVFPSA